MPPKTTLPKRAGQRTVRKKSKNATYGAELEVYAKLFAGDFKGFIKKAWIDMLSMVIGLLHLALFQGYAPFLRPVLYVTHNATFNTTEGKEKTVYSPGSNDLYLLCVLICGWVVIRDSFREMYPTIKKIFKLEMKEQLQQEFYNNFRGSLVTLVFMYCCWSITETPSIEFMANSTADSGVDVGNAMSFIHKLTLLAFVGFGITNTIMFGMGIAEKLSKQKAAEQSLAHLPGSCAIIWLYSFGFAHIAVRLLVIDTTRQFVSLVLGCANLNKKVVSVKRIKLTEVDGFFPDWWPSWKAALAFSDKFVVVFDVMTRGLLVVLGALCCLTSFSNTSIIASLGGKGESSDFQGNVAFGAIVFWQVVCPVLVKMLVTPATYSTAADSVPEKTSSAQQNTNPVSQDPSLSAATTGVEPVHDKDE